MHQRHKQLGRSPHRGQVDDGGVGRCPSEQVDYPLMAGEHEYLVGAGELDEGGGGTPRALKVEVHEDLVDDDRKPFSLFAHALDESEPER